MCIVPSCQTILRKNRRFRAKRKENTPSDVALCQVDDLYLLIVRGHNLKVQLPQEQLESWPHPQAGPLPYSQSPLLESSGSSLLLPAVAPISPPGAQLMGSGSCLAGRGPGHTM